MALLFENMTPAGQFGAACENPILDLRPLCPDAVINNFPVFLGRWEANTEQPILLDDNYSTTAPEGLCDPTTFTTEVQTCSVLMPNQKIMYFGTDEMPYRETMEAFCGAQRITRAPSLFLPDGTLDPGSPLNQPFLKYILSDLRRQMMRRLREIFWNGDGTATHQFEGVLPQLTDGLSPVAGGGGCDDYTAVEIDWNAMTDGTGTAHPEATITAANDSIIIHGQTFSGLTGMDLVDFLTMFYERVNQYDFAAYGGVDQWELWIGRGKTNCIAELAACKQPCDGCTPGTDPEQRARYARFRVNKEISLYPYDNDTIPLLESPELGNTIVFAPMVVGGRPMGGWVFRDQDEQLAILNGEVPLYGYGGDLPDATGLFPDDTLTDFPTSAFQIDVQKNGICITVAIAFEAAVALFGLGSWLVVSNVDCTALIPPTCQDTLSVAVSSCANGAGGDRLDLTMASDPTCGITAGDVVRVSFTTGGTVLQGTVISYTAGTNVLILEFPISITCTTFGAPLTVTCI